MLHNTRQLGAERLEVVCQSATQNHIGGIQSNDLNMHL